MKKYVLLILAVVVLAMSFILSVYADIPAGEGKGVSLGFDSLSRNNPSSGANVFLTEAYDDTFGTVYQYDYDGTLTNTNLQFSLNFANDIASPAGSYYYISFYYRFLQEDGCVIPNSFVRRPNVNNNSGQTSLGTPSGEWKKISFVTTATADIASGTKIQMRLIPFITAGSKIRVQIAAPVCMYYGQVTADGELTPEQVIGETLAKSDISAVYVDGNAVDMDMFPEMAYTDILWYGEELPVVSADTYIDGLYEVSCDSASLPAQYTITSYGLDYDRITGEGSKSEYTVAVDYKRAEAIMDIGGVALGSGYVTVAEDVLNVNYSLYNYSGDSKECIIALVLRDGNMFKEIITRKKTYENGITEDSCSYIVDEVSAGCTASVYIIDTENMTVIN